MTRLFCLLFLGLSLCAKGQQPTKENHDSILNAYSDNPNFKKGYFHYGTTFYLIVPSLNISSPFQLNTALTNQGAPTIGQSNLMGGFGLEERIDDLFCFGGELMTGGKYNSNDRYELNTSLFMVNIYMKYYVFPRPTKGGFYPFVGFNSYNTSVYLTDISNTNDINGLFQNSGSVNLKLNTLFLNGGIGYDLFNFKEETAFYGSIKMGIRRNIGTEDDNRWFINENNKLNGSPTETLNSFYIQLGVGISINYRERVGAL